MKKKFTKILVAMLAVMGLVSAFLPAKTAYAEDAICSQPGLTTEMKKRIGCSNSDDQFQTVIANILKSVIGVAGLVAAIYIVVGGVQYMTSAGDSSKLTKAKNTILYALIGLIVCALAFAIVNWTIGVVNNPGGTSSEEESEEEASLYYRKTIAKLGE